MSRSPIRMRGERQQTYRNVVEACGDEVAEAFSRHYGGLKVYIPKEWREGHDLTQRLGEPAARAIIAAFGETILVMPRNEVAGRARTRLIQALAAQGLSRNEIARRAKVTRRWVEMVLAGVTDERRPTLF